ncbi:MAG TPA: hypothetical protein VGV63_12680 [Acidimicrobiales bacterium]|nr:hypothetical protein [Acidimicrobiales bacterium]
MAQQVRIGRGGIVALIATFGRTSPFALLLPSVSELTLARLTRCFDDPIPNRARSGRSQPEWQGVPMTEPAYDIAAAFMGI